MSQNRREFLGAATWTGAALLLPTTLAGVLARPAPRPRTTGPSPAHPQSFRGSRAGEERTVEGIRLRWCPPGEFLMGSPPDEVGRRPDEGQVPVSLTKGFWTARTEVTQAQWRQIVGAYPAQEPSPRFGQGGDFPMYWVNFHESEGFCSTLTRRAHASAALPAEWEFRLPTEAQWEYACRAGTVTASAFGDVLGADQANFASERPEMKRADQVRGAARRVGSYAENAWGIVDMHGNVWEWCRDWYQARLPGGVDPDLYDVLGARNRDGTYSRVRRGGAWIEPAWACRSACRLRYEPPRRSDHIGFRVVAVEIGSTRTA